MHLVKAFGEDQYCEDQSFNMLTHGNSVASQLQFDDRRPFVMLALENQLEYWNYDFSAFD